MTDCSTGGLDWLHLESTEPDENGYEWIFVGRALYDYDYRMSLLTKKQDSHYLKLDFSGLRRYYDGSNGYGAWGASLEPLAEISDYDLFVDRRNYNIELGLTPPEGPQWVFGWHRLVKERQRSAPMRLRYRGIPKPWFSSKCSQHERDY
jgi:hypothetical protein